MAKKKLLDFTGLAFIRPWMGGVLFIGAPGMNLDAFPDGGATDFVRMRIERADAPEELIEPAEYFKK